MNIRWAYLGRWMIWGVLLLCSAGLWAASPIPALTQPVMDNARMMQVQEHAKLNQHLLTYAQTQGSQIVVLTVDSIAPETPFDYAARVMEAWKPGRAGIDDGVLLLLVKNERKTHLAVGRGLEGAIPDAYSKRILDDVLRPYLQQGQVDAGIQAAVLQIEKLIAGEALPEPKADHRAQDMNFIPLLLVAVVLGMVLKGIFGRKLGSVFTGALVLGIGVFFGWAWLLSLFTAFLATVFTFAGGLGTFVAGDHGRSTGSGGWRGGSGGFGGGGGFSGGGGGFGGGGASGGW